MGLFKPFCHDLREISSKLQFWILREKGLFGAHFASFGPI